MARIQDIPPEILSNVFGLLDDEARTETLVNSALVCNAWTTPAQEELWTRLEFYAGSGKIDRFLENQAALNNMRTVELSLGYFCTAEDVEVVKRILRSVRGVEKLTLFDVGNQCEVGFELLQFDSLQGLADLTLDQEVVLSPPSSPITLPFNLTRIDIIFVQNALPSSSLSLLLQPTITSASFEFHRIGSSADSQACLRAIQTIAPNIVNLKLTAVYIAQSWWERDDVDAARAGVQALFSSFTGVKRLECWWEDLEYLYDVSVTLEELLLEEAGWISAPWNPAEGNAAVCEQLVGLLNRRIEPLTNLKVVKLLLSRNANPALDLADVKRALRVKKIRFECRDSTGWVLDSWDPEEPSSELEATNSAK